MEAINNILEIQKGHFEQEAEVMVEFRKELGQVNQIATGVADEITNVGDTIVDAFLRGKQGALDFKNILRELIISIQKTIIQTLILDQVNKFVKDTITGILMVGSVGVVSIRQNLNFAVGVTNTVRAEVMNMLPAIQQSTVNAVAEAKQRGGKFSKAFGS